ncbi:MAG: 2TM domain-containing protein [Halobacteriota archaeon]
MSSVVGFNIHFSIYIAINALLIVVWWFTGDGFPWFIFPLDFWELASSHTLWVCS